MADKGERYDADGFEDAVIDDKGAAELAFRFSGNTEGLGNNSDDNDDHADKGETTGFGKLLDVSCIVALGW